MEGSVGIVREVGYGPAGDIVRVTLEDNGVTIPVRARFLRGTALDY